MKLNLHVGTERKALWWQGPEDANEEGDEGAVQVEDAEYVCPTS